MCESYASEEQPIDTTHMNNLNEMQKKAVKMVVSLVDRPATDAGGKFGMLLGKAGTGKSTTVDACHLAVDNKYGAGSVARFATTGKAASNIHGSTVHNVKDGLAIPLSNLHFKKLKGKALKDLQDRFRNVRLVIIDEFTMLWQKELHYIDLCLREIMGNNLPFGGLAVVLVGDPAQLPPVGGRSLWDNSRGQKGDDDNGYLVYTTWFNKVIKFSVIKRIDESASDATEF